MLLINMSEQILLSPVYTIPATPVQNNRITKKLERIHSLFTIR